RSAGLRQPARRGRSRGLDHDRGARPAGGTAGDDPGRDQRRRLRRPRAARRDLLRALPARRNARSGLTRIRTARAPGRRPAPWGEADACVDPGPPPAHVALALWSLAVLAAGLPE